MIDNGIPLSESLLANLMYILLSKWHLLTKHMHFKFYPCRLLLYSQFNTENAKNLAEEIQSEMGKDVTISIYDRSYIDLDSLADCDVDILITTSTLDLKLPYPVFYIYRKGFKLNTSKLNELTKQITDDKKIAYRVLIKERLSLLAEK